MWQKAKNGFVLLMQVYVAATIFVWVWSMLRPPNAVSSANPAKFVVLSNCQMPTEKIKQSVYIALGRVRGCANFSSTTTSNPMDILPFIKEGDVRACRQDIEQFIALVPKIHPTQDLFCDAAMMHRDQGVGLNLAVVEQGARSAVAADERVIGMWVAPHHPCGLFTLVETPRGTKDYLTCYDGRATRSEVRKMLEPISRPNVTKAWQTAGLKPHKFVFAGESGIEYFDAQKQRHDLSTYVWLLNGQLEVYSDGVGVSRAEAKVPWAVAIPIEAYKAAQPNLR
jgi:hypothetical protein